ncbi:MULTISPECIES: nuclear transport factor 2 family protein [unclassified Ruegeria]|uniref:nuclear transport factor 2 family protein n=1 Tax=unclassified Ruegeria TaxID=2625375 RepID=UPI0020C4466C|nr:MULTISPECIES: nuclear transport factor 2 family protein [unclassified Ruegeria]
MTPKELVLALFSAAFIDHDPEAARQMVSADYIQHNPQVPTGAEGLMGLIPLVGQSGMTATTHRVIAEGDMVVLHNTYDNADAVEPLRLRPLISSAWKMERLSNTGTICNPSPKPLRQGVA